MHFLLFFFYYGLFINLLFSKKSINSQNKGCNNFTVDYYK